MCPGGLYPGEYLVARRLVSEGSDPSPGAWLESPGVRAQSPGDRIKDRKPGSNDKEARSKDR